MFLNVVHSLFIVYFLINQALSLKMYFEQTYVLHNSYSYQRKQWVTVFSHGYQMSAVVVVLTASNYGRHL